MKNYHDLLRDILNNGTRKTNRTGIDTIMLPGAMLKFDLRDGFPAITTKELKFDAVKGELIGFLRGCTSAADFRALGCNVWNKNANEHGVDMQGNHVENKWLSNIHRKGQDDLGRIYGVQWREWVGTDSEGNPYEVDQIAEALRKVRETPDDRRIIVSAWQPAELDQMALPPCHLLFQLLPDASTKTLHMTMYMRSADMFLGVPFNIASYALLLHLFAAWAGYDAGTLTMFLADAHIYVNHVDQVKEQLTREEFPLPTLQLDLPIMAEMRDLDFLLEHLHPDDIRLDGYQSHPPLKAPMAV